MSIKLSVLEHCQFERKVLDALEERLRHPNGDVSTDIAEEMHRGAEEAREKWSELAARGEISHEEDIRGRPTPSSIRDEHLVAPPVNERLRRLIDFILESQSPLPSLVESDVLGAFQTAFEFASTDRARFCDLFKTQLTVAMSPHAERFPILNSPEGIQIIPVREGQVLLRSPGLGRSLLPDLLWHLPERLWINIDQSDHATVWGVASGHASRAAFGAFYRKVVSTVPPIAEALFTLRQTENLLSMNSPNFEQANSLSASGLSRDFSLVADVLNHVSKILRVYFARDGGALSQRIRNAIELIVEAQRSSPGALKVALAMTAIEALVGAKSEMTSAVAESAAVILEDESQHRESAVRFIKELYNVRSRALHGERLEAEALPEMDAQCLAVAVLRGVIEYQSMQRRAGNESVTLDEWVSELRAGKYRARSIMAVQQSPICWRWRSNAKLKFQ